MVYIIPLWVLLWLAGIQGDIIYVNTEVDTLMASVGLNPMGPVKCVSTCELSLSSCQSLLCLLD